MIVLDASVVVQLLTGGSHAGELRRLVTSSAESLAVPHLLDVEVTNALRNLAVGQRIDPHRVAGYLVDLAELPAERYPHTDLLPRVWELRHNFTSYDAVYIALAEHLDATLYTADTKLMRGHKARVVLFTR